ncbi:MAG: hypothetical protein V2A76_03145 [Planctomycetota bacterium]
MHVQSRIRPSFFRLALLIPLALPACATDQGGLDLFPLYRNQQEADRGEFSVLWPLSNFEWDQEGEVSWTVPFHVHMSKVDGDELTMVPAIPLYFHQRGLDLETTTVLPLYSRTIAGARTQTSLLLFLADWARMEGEEGLDGMSVFPLFQWRKEGAGEMLSFLRVLELGPTGPAVSLLDIDRTGLSYGEGEDQAALSVDVASVFGRIVNLFHYDDEGSHTDLRFLTIFANEDWSLFQRRTPHEGAPGTDTARTVFFPLYFDIQHDALHRTRIAWPIYGTTSRGERTINQYILFPLLKLTDDPEGQLSGFDFLWPLIGREKTPLETTTWFQPLFKHIGYEEGYEWTVLLNMFGYGRVGEKSRVRLFWFPWEL